MDLSGTRGVYGILFTCIFTVHVAQVLVQSMTVDPQQCCSFTNYKTNVSACCIRPSCVTTNFTCAALNGSFKTLQIDRSLVCPTIVETTTDTQTTESLGYSSETTTTITTAAVESTRTLNFICVDKCPVGYYVESGYCMECNHACASCHGNGLATDTCDCKYGNNGSYCCPKGYKSVQNQNGTECVTVYTTTTPEPSTTPIALIIGPAVGGGVLVVLVIVVVCCCCCRKTNNDSKGTKHRPFSSLMNKRNKQNDEEKMDALEVPEGTCGFEQHTYQNIAQVNQARVALHAQRQGDNIFRYAKDPTEKKQKQKSTRKDVSSMYENKNTIKLHQNMQASNELEEIKDLPVAPQPPSQKSGKKKSFKYRLSKKLHLGAKKMASPPEPASESEGDYLPMEDHPKHQQEIYEPMQEISQDLDDYANQSVISELRKTQKKKGVPQNTGDIGSVSEGPTEDYENLAQNQSTNQTEDQSDDQEDYENFHSAHEVCQDDSAVSPEYDDNGPQEDYENFHSAHEVCHDNPAFSPEDKDNEPQEDYENFQQVQESFRGDPNVGSEFNDIGPQEDYENFVFPTQKQVEDSPYANWRRK